MEIKITKKPIGPLTEIITAIQEKGVFKNAYITRRGNDYYIKSGANGIHASQASNVTNASGPNAVHLCNERRWEK